MKQLIFTFCLFIFSIIGKSQDVIPSKNLEYCPNIVYQYDYIIPSGKSFKDVSSKDGAIIINYVQGTGTSLLSIFAKFSDFAHSQTITVNYLNGSPTDFVFNKIKSFFKSQKRSIFPRDLGWKI